LLNKQESGEDFITLLKKALFECLATFFFMISIYFSKGDIKISIFGMWSILCCFGIVSCDHVNPSFTFGFYIYEGNWINGGNQICFKFLVSNIRVYSRSFDFNTCKSKLC